MSVLDLPLDVDHDEVRIASVPGRTAGTNGKQRRTIGQYVARHTTNHWGVSGTKTVPTTAPDDTYDEAFGPRPRVHRQTAEWQDHQAEALVVRLAAADQARDNVIAHTVMVCPQCHSTFTPEERRGPRQRYCTDACKRHWNNHQVIERYREKQAERLIVAAFSMGAG